MIEAADIKDGALVAAETDVVFAQVGLQRLDNHGVVRPATTGGRGFPRTTCQPVAVLHYSAHTLEPQLGLQVLLLEALALALRC